MTFDEFITIVRRRWLVVVVCAVAAAAVTWSLSPAHPSKSKHVSTYTATATLLVNKSEHSPVTMDRVVLYFTKGKVPRKAARRLNYDGGAKQLADEVEIKSHKGDAVTIAATEPSGKEAANLANTFAAEAVHFFAKPPAGAKRVGVSVLQKATPSPDVTKNASVIPPSRSVRTAIAAALGLLIGLAAAVIVDRLDSRLRSREQIGQALGLPILAEVPKMPRSWRQEHIIGVSEDPLGPYADSHRTARTALLHATSHPPDGIGASGTLLESDASGTPVILVTSAFALEGKTTTVANLAASFAETGQQVVVIDADLRSPGIHVPFNMPHATGVSDYLTDPDESILETLLRPTDIPGVKVMTGGTGLTHPPSLVSHIGSLISHLRQRADVVLIDSAPLLMASDVFDLLPSVDSLLYVARSGRLTHADGQHVLELLERFGAPVSGAVIIGSKTGRGGRYRWGYEQQRKHPQWTTRRHAGATGKDEIDEDAEPTLHQRTGLQQLASTPRHCAIEARRSSGPVAGAAAL